MQILSLPKVVIVDVLSNWIETNDLVHLDSAFCNSTSSRDVLLDLFEKEYFTTGGNFVTTKCLEYVNIRKLKLKTLSLNDNFGSRRMIHDLTASKVRSLKIFGCQQWKLPRLELVSLFNACSMLRELELDGVQSCRDDVIVQFSPIILSQLTDIIIRQPYFKKRRQLSDIFVSHLSTHCGNLQSIQFGFGNQSIGSVAMLKLIRNNPQLKDLTLSWRQWFDNPEFAYLVDWSSVNVLQSVGFTYTLNVDVISQHFTLQIIALDNFVASKTTVVVAEGLCNFKMGVKDLLMLFEGLNEIDLGCRYFSPFNIYQTIIQRNPNLTSLTACLLNFPDDIIFVFEKCVKLVKVTSAGCEYRPSFTITPAVPESSDGLKIKLTEATFTFCNTVILWSILRAVPRLCEAELFGMIVACRLDIEGKCLERGIEMLWKRS
jgi:hypothetical protein